MLRVLSLGAGVQSSTLALMFKHANSDIACQIESELIHVK